MLATETQARRFWLLAIYVSGVFAIIATHVLRDHGVQGPAASLALGSLPNFVAAASAPALIMCWRKRHVGMAAGLVGAVLAQVLVLGWEFVQLARPEMVFDANDIMATLLGGLAWMLAWLGLDRFLPGTRLDPGMSAPDLQDHCLVQQDALRDGSAGSSP